MKETIRIFNKDISIVNNKIYINGEEYTPKNKNVSEIEFEGEVNTLTADCSFTIKGNVNGDIDLGGSLSVTGDVDGDIDTGGSVSIVGNHKGDIDAGGSVSIIGG